MQMAQTQPTDVWRAVTCRHMFRHPLPSSFRNTVQGLSGGPQLQLLSLALSALEQQLAALPEAARHASEEEWRMLVAALLASCSLAAARAWLGYVPAELQRQASAVISQLTAGPQLCPTKLLETKAKTALLAAAACVITDCHCGTLCGWQTAAST